eukprot:4739538-Pyramimonas_sp.AAC.1
MLDAAVRRDDIEAAPPALIQVQHVVAAVHLVLRDAHHHARVVVRGGDDHLLIQLMVDNRLNPGGDGAEHRRLDRLCGIVTSVTTTQR